MKREAPKLALAWTDGVHPKRYVSKQSAYYAIAKRMVVEKYPPMLANAYAMRDPGVLDENWTDDLVERRTEKMFALFYIEASDGYFDERRWRRFVTRVARFLAFVDSKRTADELLDQRFGGLLPSESLALAEAEYEATERASVELAKRAVELRRYIDARSQR